MKNRFKFKNKALYLKYFVFLLAFSLIGCEEVIQVDLDTGEDKIVIDAEILWQKGTDGSVQVIKISRMAGYYNQEVPQVSGAEVYIENSEGAVFTFTEAAPGSYICDNFIPELNGIYSLYVRVGDEVFTASETLMPVSEINRVEQEAISGFGEDEIEVSIYFNDPADETNFYVTGFSSDALLYPEYETTDDEFFNGNEIRSEYSNETITSGKIVDITLRGVSEQFHDYMGLILEMTDSGPFSPPAANVKGNITNQNDQGSNALGYFRLCETDHVMYIVE